METLELSPNIIAPEHPVISVLNFGFPAILLDFAFSQTNGETESGTQSPGVSKVWRHPSSPSPLKAECLDTRS